MKKLYIILAIIGFIVPNIFVLTETFETGNILFWTQPALTLNGMFANQISTAFSIDLLLVVVVFFVWTFIEARKYHMRSVWFVWIITLLFGMAGAFPLFLYLRERKKANVSIEGQAKYGYTRVSN